MTTIKDSKWSTNNYKSTWEKWHPTLRVTYHNLCPVRLYLGWNKRQRECTSCQCEGAAAHKEPRICPQHIGRHAHSRRTCKLIIFERSSSDGVCPWQRPTPKSDTSVQQTWLQLHRKQWRLFPEMHGHIRLISTYLGLSQTPAYTARPWMRS